MRLIAMFNIDSNRRTPVQGRRNGARNIFIWSRHRYRRIGISRREIPDVRMEVYLRTNAVTVRPSDRIEKCANGEFSAKIAGEDALRINPATLPKSPQWIWIQVPFSVEDTNTAWLDMICMWRIQSLSFETPLSRARNGQRGQKDVEWKTETKFECRSQNFISTLPHEANFCVYSR